MMSSQLELSKIEIDRALQSRIGGVNGPVASDYEDAMREGVVFPPIVVFFDGDQYHLADGFHRVSAAVHLGLTTISADMREGSKRDAEFFAMTEANSTHGLQLTRDDKRKRAQHLLMDDEWSQLSNREIARRTGVSHTFVAYVRESLSSPQNGSVATKSAKAVAEELESARLEKIAARNQQVMDTDPVGEYRYLETLDTVLMIIGYSWR